MLLLACAESPQEELKKWLNKVPEKRSPIESLALSSKSLSKEEAILCAKDLLEDHQAQLLKEFSEQWEDRKLVLGSHEMPFFYKVFGEAPSDGRSLFISLHGGGGAPSEVNDQQYLNQQGLYNKTMDTLEGVYLAPRAIANTWNLWHLCEVDSFINILIQMAVLKEGVNPNKVYLLGYSAGGDGVYQLAPRSADRWAAAAMMAGHPNETTYHGLRNLPFALHMGALDSAYNRNKIAAQWSVLLDSLSANENGTYQHQVQLHEGKGHWMFREDAVALPWMQNHNRNAIPEKVIWKQDGCLQTSFYWLAVPKKSIKVGGIIRAEYDKSNNVINILENYSDILEIRINDKMLDLDKPISILFQGQEVYKGMLKRTIQNIHQTLQDKGDPDLAFPVILSILNNENVVVL